VLYCNDGDWVENCTALIETQSGELQLWNWAEEQYGAPDQPESLAVERAA
jgi:hypothetical protein